MEQKEGRNLLLLGASLLVVGLVLEFFKRKFLAYPMHVAYKTIIEMFLIAVGYSFAGGIVAPFAKRSLHILQHPFIRLFRPRWGKIIFYLTIYGVLFVLYLLVFIYGMDITSISSSAVNVSKIVA